jgi:glutathione synthase
MKIAFVVNDVQTEEATYTTTRLAMAAIHRGHKAYTFGVADFAYAPEGAIHAHARSVRGSKYKSLEKYLADLQDEDNEPECICLDEVDVLMLRNDPSADAIERPWAQTVGILFGQLIAARGVLVVNDPEHLAHAINKTYFQHFPEEVRPRTCISRNVEELKEFIEQEQGKAIIKPLQGSGGKNVFLVGQDEKANLNQMIEAVLRDGYCVAQEYLPAAIEGDVRLFVMNGQPLAHNGKIASFRRVNQSGDARSNMHTGGKSEPAEMTAKMQRIVEIVRPKLMADDMFLVGLDIVDDKLIEINVFTPGGLGSAAQFTDVDFASIVLADLERKIENKKYYGARMTNAELATM